jgi:hypothetical protein
MSALSLMAVPVLLETTDEPTQLYRQWVTMYGHGHQVLPGLAIITAGLYARIALSLRSTTRPWSLFVLAGLATVAIIPFTLVFMVPTNDLLFALEKGTEKGTEKGQGSMSIMDAKELVLWWSRLHLMRSVMPLIGAVIGVSAVVKDAGV